MIDLFLMNRAKKNYQYIIAGISIGITLYTYCLTWITIPIFLVFWSLYMLYVKETKIKKLIILAIPIIIFAMPLIYFLLLNYGIVSNTQIGIFTVPILTDFRGDEISLLNIFTKSFSNIKTIFLSENTIYLIYIPLFIIGYIVSIIKSIKSTKAKQYSVNTVMTIAFSTIFIGLMMVNVASPNKANVLYIPILYFVTVALEYIFKNSKILLLVTILLITVLFINFEYNYYTKYSIGIGRDTFSTQYLKWFNDKTLTELISKLEQNEETKNVQKHVFTYRASPYIYQLLATKMSPYEFKENLQTKDLETWEEIVRVGNYNYYTQINYKEDFLNNDFKSEDCIIIISEEIMSAVRKFEKNYKQYEYEDLYIFINEDSNLPIETIIKNAL